MPTNPHTQLDQQPADAAPRRALGAALVDLPGVRQDPSRISVPGAVALLLEGPAAAGPPEAFLVPSEVAHLHPDPDRSLHVTLPPELAEQAVQAGWAEADVVAAWCRVVGLGHRVGSGLSRPAQPVALDTNNHDGMFVARVRDAVVGS